MALFWAADTHSDTGNIITKHVFPRYEGIGKAAAIIDRLVRYWNTADPTQ
jgi:hypothetical protein